MISMVFARGCHAQQGGEGKKISSRREAASGKWLKGPGEGQASRTGSLDSEAPAWEPTEWVEPGCARSAPLGSIGQDASLVILGGLPKGPLGGI